MAAKSSSSREFPWVRFIQSPTNLGFATANNLAAEHAHGDVLPVSQSRIPRWRRSATSVVHTRPATGAPGHFGPAPAEYRRHVADELRAENANHSQSAARHGLPAEAPGEILAWENARTTRARSSQSSCRGRIRSLHADAAGGIHQCRRLQHGRISCTRKISTCAGRFAAPGMRITTMRRRDIVHHGGGSTRKTRNKFAEIMIPQSLTRLLTKARGSAYGDGVSSRIDARGGRSGAAAAAPLSAADRRVRGKAAGP